MNRAGKRELARDKLGGELSATKAQELKEKIAQLEALILTKDKRIQEMSLKLEAKITETES